MTRCLVYYTKHFILSIDRILHQFYSDSVRAVCYSGVKPPTGPRKPAGSSVKLVDL